MQVVARLVDIYRRNGYEIVTGLSPRHANNWLADYTFLFQEKRSRTHHLGIAPQCPSGDFMCRMNRLSGAPS